MAFAAGFWVDCEWVVNDSCTISTSQGPAARAERLNPPRLPLKPSGVLGEFDARGHPRGEPSKFPQGT